ncbi:MAG: lysyl-tRNA synthetase class 2, partial [Planctomycetota bacterium]
RNEGLSTRHNPEFTMLELYQAQGNFHHMMEIAESMIETLATELNGTTEVKFRGGTYDFKAPFKRQRYDELFKQANGFEIDDEEAVRARAKELDVHVDPSLGYWKLAAEVFEETVEESLTGPVFVTHYPVAISPLAKVDPDDCRYAERYELFVGGMELANAFSELNDPQEQQRRFEEQVERKDPDDPGEVDIDYVQALEYGMPPAGGLGIGMDRLAMVLLDQDSIRDVILFPAMKPRSGDSAEEEAAKSEEVVPES